MLWDSYACLGPDIIHTPQQEAAEVKEYKDLFDHDTVGKLPVIYHVRLDGTVYSAVCTPCSQVPIAMMEKVKAELHRMTAVGIIILEN